MLGLSHGAFKKKLIGRCKRNGNDVIIMDESYTSKTCGKCGELHDINGKEVYKCTKCGLRIDRDINGARNIMIRLLTKNEEIEENNNKNEIKKERKKKVIKIPKE